MIGATDKCGTPTFVEMVGSFRRGFKPRSAWSLGLEVEKLPVDAATGAALPYEGARASIRSILEMYEAARPSRRVLEGENLIALEGGWGTITLEPGGQVEWSSPPARDLAELEEMLRDHLEILDRSRELGVRWIARGVHPEQSLDAMIWMPKQRYRIMRDYLGRRGRHAHRMMTQTASVQVSVDYADEADWREKFRAGFLLAPLAVAAFANSRTYEGRDSGWASFRSGIWRETDPDRCGAPGFVFKPEFTLADWTRYLVEMPMMFVRGPDGLEAAGGMLFSEFMRDGWKGRCASMDDWLLHVTGVFTEARTKTYIELRSADLQPDDRIIEVPRFWVGLMYDTAAREAALSLLGWGPRGTLPTAAEWREAIETAAREGAEARLRGRRLGDLAGEALGIARAAALAR